MRKNFSLDLKRYYIKTYMTFPKNSRCKIAIKKKAKHKFRLYFLRKSIFTNQTTNENLNDLFGLI